MTNSLKQWVWEVNLYLISSVSLMFFNFFIFWYFMETLVTGFLLQEEMAENQGESKVQDYKVWLQKWKDCQHSGL